MNKIIFNQVILLISLGSSAISADVLTNATIYVPNCNSCYQLCHNTETTGKIISNCQCGGLSALTQAGFSDNLTLVGSCGDETCSFDDLKTTMQNSLEICTYTLTIENESNTAGRSNDAHPKNK